MVKSIKMTIKDKFKVKIYLTKNVRTTVEAVPIKGMNFKAIIDAFCLERSRIIPLE